MSTIAKSDTYQIGEKGERMNVCYMSSLEYLKYLYVSVYSLFENNKNYKIIVYLLSFEITEEDIEKLNFLAQKYGNEIVLLKIDKDYFVNGLSENLLHLWPRGGAIPLLQYIMFDVLPDDVDKIICFHVDMLVKADLGEVYFKDLNDFYALSIDDSYVFEGDEWPRLRERIQSDLSIMNLKKPCSVMFKIFNVGMIREEGVNFEYFKKLAANSETSWFYDEVFTKAFCNKVTYCRGVEYSYESMERRADIVGSSFLEYRTKSKIVHYDYIKPWDGNSGNPMDFLWWEYAKETPYYDEFKKFHDESYVKYIESVRETLGQITAITILNRLQNKKVAIYGAGHWGNMYHGNLRCRGYCNVVGWFDKNAHKINREMELPFFVRKVEDLKEIEYDYILVAVDKKELALQIKKELQDMGIAEEKIVWRYAWED